MVLCQVNGIEALLHLLIEFVGFLRGLQVGQQHGFQNQVFFLQVEESPEEGITRRECADIDISRPGLLENPPQQAERVKATAQVRLQRVRGQGTQELTRTLALAHCSERFLFPQRQNH